MTDLPDRGRDGNASTARVREAGTEEQGADPLPTLTGVVDDPHPVHSHHCDPVSAADIEDRLGIRSRTVAVWGTRGLLPPPTWTKRGGGKGVMAMWCWKDEGVREAFEERARVWRELSPRGGESGESGCGGGGADNRAGHRATEQGERQMTIAITTTTINSLAIIVLGLAYILHLFLFHR